MSLNPGCYYRNCTLPTGPTVSLVNLTVLDNPVQAVEYRWLWSVIGHPTLQAAITEPGDKIKIKWNSIFGFGPLDNSINYEKGPIYSAALMLLNVSLKTPWDLVFFAYIIIDQNILNLYASAYANNSRAVMASDSPKTKY